MIYIIESQNTFIFFKTKDTKNLIITVYYVQNNAKLEFYTIFIYFNFLYKNEDQSF